MAVRFCQCPSPDPEPIEGIDVCRTCDERVPDPLVKLVLAEVVALRKQVAALEGKRGGSRAGEWITPTEAAERFGFQPRWYRENAVKLGGEKRGDGPRPRWMFNAEALAERIEGLGR